MESIILKPIGVIHTPFTDPTSMPIQPVSENSAKGSVEVFLEFAAGLKDLEGFSHLLLLYHFHRSRHYSLSVTPFLDTVPRGLFATRAPNRPNPIGISLVRLVRIEGSLLHVENIDIIDGTPLLDIKPHVPDFDCAPGARIGWVEKATAEMRRKVADDRFHR
ncbi:MAG: tRNA (N6-threonylcarbamoyladenosine(37)-N6)-methyltransferase TrmO [Desulfobacterales bacterium]|jgi:tRNA-Thr(GGU) m(6)t(6)A37 methyltransferase TsaA|nr:tRNA (N6-threonylcarbamoyladenosine(37)-N6)-methyltransferase TrmO [Desulfobacterales bacterium]